LGGRAARVLVAVSLAAACTNAPAGSPAGGLQVVIESDMGVPRDIDHLQLLVTQGGATLLSVDQDLGPGALTIPAAYQIKDTGSTALVSIHAVASKSGAPRAERDAVTPIPQSQAGQVNLALDFACVSYAQDPDGGVSSTCPAGLTCVRGSCVSTLLLTAAMSLPDASMESGAVEGDGLRPPDGGSLVDAAPDATPGVTCSGRRSRYRI
jgi:hypothetical protein